MRNNNACVSDPNSFVTNPGDRFHINYSPVINSDGTITLKESGRDDIQEMIDSQREFTDMNYIISRLQLGDSSVLHSGSAMYGDFTNIPSSQAEVLQVVMDAEKSFYQLPLDVRNNFNNDFRQWFAQVGSENWFSGMKSVFDSESVSSDVIDSEVKSDES